MSTAYVTLEEFDAACKVLAERMANVLANESPVVALGALANISHAVIKQSSGSAGMTFARLIMQSAEKNLIAEALAAALISEPAKSSNAPADVSTQLVPPTTH